MKLTDEAVTDALRREVVALTAAEARYSITRNAEIDRDAIKPQTIAASLKRLEKAGRVGRKPGRHVTSWKTWVKDYREADRYILIEKA